MKHFLNDRDGVSARDFILTISIFFFVAFWVVGLVFELMGNPLSETYLDLFSQMKTVVMTIVASVFTVTGVKYGADAISRKRGQKDNLVNERQNKPYPPQNDYPQEGDYGNRG